MPVASASRCDVAANQTSPAHAAMHDVQVTRINTCQDHKKCLQLKGFLIARKVFPRCAEVDGESRAAEKNQRYGL
jgi:hypothetical protein